MIRRELADRLGAVTLDALRSDSPDVNKVGIILTCIMGCIDGDEIVDREVLDQLVLASASLGSHRLGEHVRSLVTHTYEKTLEQAFGMLRTDPIVLDVTYEHERAKREEKKQHNGE